MQHSQKVLTYLGMDAARGGDLETLRGGDLLPLRAGLADLEADLEADLHHDIRSLAASVQA